jgi:antitoxin (DNA-binding transcriptional repressor) of toxin-antitoxin stability system
VSHHGRRLNSAARSRLDGDTFQVSPLRMKAITSKFLHERTAHCLDRVQEGERLEVYRNGKLRALLIPAEVEQDPEWRDIMRDVWAAQKEAGPRRKNPVLAERQRRNRAARLR